MSSCENRGAYYRCTAIDGTAIAAHRTYDVASANISIIATFPNGVESICANRLYSDPEFAKVKAQELCFTRNEYLEQQGFEGKPACFIPEESKPYPLCIGQGWEICGRCTLWAEYPDSPPRG